MSNNPPAAAVTPPRQTKDDFETLPLDVDDLSDAALGAFVRRELERSRARFVKLFHAKVDRRWKLHHTLVKEP